MDNKALTGLTQTLEAAELVKAVEIIKKIRETSLYNIKITIFTAGCRCYIFERSSLCTVATSALEES